MGSVSTSSLWLRNGEIVSGVQVEGFVCPSLGVISYAIGSLLSNWRVVVHRKFEKKVVLHERAVRGTSRSRIESLGVALRFGHGISESEEYLAVCHRAQ
mmetsp:Transcript_178770/g.567282  ORF Transcript_178770/g.567282 Transcript_178770/m.567282 type:complete len:99 (-) Transcript_178770:23-319(-)